jgi:hypothetical protein
MFLLCFLNTGFRAAATAGDVGGDEDIGMGERWRENMKFVASHSMEDIAVGVSANGRESYRGAQAVRN